jgi:glucose/arabinose dehydrogenase
MKNKSARSIAALLLASVLITASPGLGGQPTATVAAPVAQEVNITPQTVVSGLDTLWALAYAPDGRTFLTERPGRVRVIEGGRLLAEPWATIEGVIEVGESGLLGMALDPNFASNGYVYLAYTTSTNQNRYVNRLVRYREDRNTKKGVADKVLIDGIIGNNNHNGGAVAFGPDGKLYWTMGDRFDDNLAQQLSNLNGKILRLNSDGTIPADNPIPNSYIYTYGHRNPQGLAWQPGTNNLFSTEHGPSGGQGCCLDEVNVIEAGKNYGWPIIRGTQGREGMVSPAATSGQNATWAPGGATFISAGPWRGSLVFGGLRGQALYRAIIDPNDPKKIVRIEEHLKGTFGRIRGVYETREKDGSLFILTSNKDGRGSPAADDDRVIRLSFGGTGGPPPSIPGSGSQRFPETGKTVTGIFLDYWNNNGGLPQQGYPISDLMNETSDLDGKNYVVQYFERAVFEYHPEQTDPRFQVLLSQLGTFRYRQKYPNGAPNQQPNTSAGSRLFSETGKRVGGKFLEYWNNNGGLAQQGLPISDEFTERSDLNGREYRVQYFERAVFELHPENQPPYDVLLSQLGTFRYRQKYP